MNDKNQNKPFTTNQIENNKNAIPRTVNVLSGWIANSMNGGHNRTIHFKKIMAGEKHREYRLKLNIKMLTPKTPTYQQLKATIRTYFVPNSRIWENAEKYTAQKGGSTETKINEIPNIGDINIPILKTSENESKWTIISNTTTWRDSFIASYIPRIGKLNEIITENYIPPTEIKFPKISVLPLRGRIAIYNDFERNKEYDEEIQEYKEDTVTTNEIRNYLPSNIGTSTTGIPETEYQKIEKYTMRAKKENSYYSDYRTELQGFESESPTENGQLENNTTSLITWAAWESKIAESRSQAENAQMNDWDVIAKIRGSKKLTEGKVQLIGQNTFNLNYATITQNAYNTNSNIEPEFQVLGQQGAYSYTEVDIPLYAAMEFVEEGYIHVIMTVSADTVYENGVDRNDLNITPLDEYRPDMLNDKKDILYKIEMGTEHIENIEQYTEAIGFKRRYNEYFKLRNTIAGDMTTNDYYGYINQSTYQPSKIITQKTFQFFDNNPEKIILPNSEIIEKKIWKDYTDFHINKNQAIQNEVVKYSDNNYFINGHNQIFLVGLATCVAELPIDGSIAENYTKWGEH